MRLKEVVKYFKRELAKRQGITMMECLLKIQKDKCFSETFGFLFGTSSVYVLCATNIYIRLLEVSSDYFMTVLYSFEDLIIIESYKVWLKT